MQIVRLNCAFSRNLGRGDDVDGLGAIMRGILRIVNFIHYTPFAQNDKLVKTRITVYS